MNAQNQCNRMKLWSTERKSIESFWKYCHLMNYNYFLISLSLSYEKQLLEWIQITQPLLFSSTPAGHNISIISALTQTHKKIHTHSWWCSELKAQPFETVIVLLTCSWQNNIVAHDAKVYVCVYRREMQHFMIIFYEKCWIICVHKNEWSSRSCGKHTTEKSIWFCFSNQNLHRGRNRTLEHLYSIVEESR